MPFWPCTYFPEDSPVRVAKLECTEPCDLLKRDQGGQPIAAGRSASPGFTRSLGTVGTKGQRTLGD